MTLRRYSGLHNQLSPRNTSRPKWLILDSFDPPDFNALLISTHPGNQGNGAEKSVHHHSGVMNSVIHHHVFISLPDQESGHLTGPGCAGKFDVSFHPVVIHALWFPRGITIDLIVKIEL